MVNTTISIKDSGERSVSRGGTESVLSNGGTEFTLNVTRLNLNINPLLSTETTKRYRSGTDTNEYVQGEVDNGGIDFRKWSISVVFNLENATDRNNLGYLSFMAQTKCYKTLVLTNDSSFLALPRYATKDVLNTPISEINGWIADLQFAQDFNLYEKGHIVNASFSFIETN